LEETKMMNADAKRVVTGKVRLSYAHLITPRAQEQGGKLKYSVTLLIPKSDVATKQRIDAAIQAAIQEGIASRWGGVRPTQPSQPVWDGDGLRSTGEQFSEECKGHWVMTASSEQKPQVVDVNLNEILNATDIYSGMYGRVSIRFFAYFSSGKKGIGCGLNNVQKIEDGVPLGGRTSVSDDFGSGANNYSAPQYQQPTVYQAPIQPQYQAPVYQQPMAQPQPQYQQPMVQPQYQAPIYQAPVYQPVQPQPIDPLTGMPYNGGIMGL
jgi:hypothetical protein